jgi:hypothetical protein
MRKITTPPLKAVGTMERLAREESKRIAYLQSAKGKGELQEALLQITDGSKEARLAGARTLAKIATSESFEPILSAIETEKDPAVREKLVEALCSTSNGGVFEVTQSAIQRLESVLAKESELKIATDIAISFLHFHPGGRENLFDYLHELSGRLGNELGKNSTACRGITAAIGDLASTGLI